MKKKKLGYQEGFADYLARFGCGALVGLVFAFLAVVRLYIETIQEGIWIIVVCGVFAAIAWNPFWRLIQEIGHIFTWFRYK